MNEKLTELSQVLQQLCERAVKETDPETQSQISAEIYRVVAERDRIRKTVALNPE